jgi:hypothetical protein
MNHSGWILYFKTREMSLKIYTRDAHHRLVIQRAPVTQLTRSSPEWGGMGRAPHLAPLSPHRGEGGLRPLFVRIGRTSTPIGLAPMATRCRPIRGSIVACHVTARVRTMRPRTSPPPPPPTQPRVAGDRTQLIATHLITQCAPAPNAAASCSHGRQPVDTGTHTAASPEWGDMRRALRRSCCPSRGSVEHLPNQFRHKRSQAEMTTITQ